MIPLVAGALGVIIGGIFIIIGLARFSIGLDKTLSLTNVQIILWSGVILGSYLSLATLKGGFLPEISSNLLALMGVSAGSLVAAKGVRAIQEDQLKRDRARNNAAAPSMERETENPITGGLLAAEENSQKYSVAKFQMFAWTLVSISIFVIIVAGKVLNNTPEMPDVGTDLLALMGISHGAYIGNKIADKRE